MPFSTPSLARALPFVLVLVAGCATAPTASDADDADESLVARVQNAKSDDPDAWRELHSPHFIFVTNLGSAHARERLARLELLRSALIAAVWPHAHFPETPVRVVCFSSMLAEQQVRPPHTADFLFDFEGGLPVFAWQYENQQQPWVMHQLFHALSAQAGLRQPVWMQDGLAAYFSTIRIDADGTSAEVGNAAFDPRVNMRWEGSRMPLVQLFKMTRADLGAAYGDNREYYEAAESLVAYLFNEQAAGWVEFQKRLNAGEEQAHALWAALPGFDFPKLEAALARFQNAGVFHTRTVAVPAPPAPTGWSERALDPAEIALLHAELAGLELGVPAADRVEGVRAQLQAGLVKSPEEPRLLEALAELDARLGHCADARGEDARAVAKGALPPGAAERHAAVLAACPAPAHP